MRWRQFPIIELCVIVTAVFVALAVFGCGLKAGVNEVGRDQRTVAGNVGSGNDLTVMPITPHVNQSRTATTQTAAAEAGDRGVALAAPESARGGDNDQKGMVNVNYAPIAMSGLGLAALYLVWTYLNRRTDAKYDLAVIGRVFDAVGKMLDRKD